MASLKTGSVADLQRSVRSNVSESIVERVRGCFLRGSTQSTYELSGENQIPNAKTFRVL